MILVMRTDITPHILELHTHAWNIPLMASNLLKVRADVKVMQHKKTILSRYKVLINGLNQVVANWTVLEDAWLGLNALNLKIAKASSTKSCAAGRERLSMFR